MRKHITLITLLFSVPALLFAQYPYRDANQKWGVIDTDLQVLAAPAYDTIHLYENNYAIAKKGNHYGLLTESGMPAKEYPFSYDKVELERPGPLATYEDPLVFIYQKDGKFGCKINGQQFDRPIYDTIYINFGNPKHLFFKKKKKEYFLNEAGAIERTKKREFSFWAVGDALYHVLPLLEIVEKNGLKGLRNIESGKIEIPETYQEIRDLDIQGFILITSDQKYGLVDTGGQRILADEYQKIEQLYDNFLQVEEFSGRKGYLINGQLLLP